MDRKIFPYQRSGQPAFGDPLALRRRLTALLQGEVDQVLQDSHSKEASLALPAVERLRWAVCEAFELGQPFDSTTGQGVLEEEWMGVLSAYTEWLEKNALSVENSPTPAPSTVSESSAVP